MQWVACMQSPHKRGVCAQSDREGKGGGERQTCMHAYISNHKSTSYRSEMSCRFSKRLELSWCIRVWTGNGWLLLLCCCAVVLLMFHGSAVRGYVCLFMWMCASVKCFGKRISL